MEKSMVLKSIAQHTGLPKALVSCMLNNQEEKNIGKVTVVKFINTATEIYPKLIRIYNKAKQSKLFYYPLFPPLKSLEAPEKAAFDTLMQEKKNKRFYKHLYVESGPFIKMI